MRIICQIAITSLQTFSRIIKRFVWMIGCNFVVFKICLHEIYVSVCWKLEAKYIAVAIYSILFYGAILFPIKDYSDKMRRSLTSLLSTLESLALKGCKEREIIE